MIIIGELYYPLFFSHCVMTKTTLGILSIGLICAILLGLRTLFYSSGSILTTGTKTASFITQSHPSAPPNGSYVPFDPTYGLQGTQRSVQKSWRPGKSELLVVGSE